MRIVDLSTDVAGRFAAKLFAMAGCTVLRPVLARKRAASSPTDALSIYLDWKKQTVFLDDENALAELLISADLVFTSFDAGRYLGLAASRPVLAPACVEVTTSSFGITGPYAAFRGGPLADWAAGGYLAITGEPGRPPLMGPKNLCAYVCGYEAALGAEAALLARRSEGRGLHVDVSTMETMLCLHQSTFSQLTAGLVRNRTGRYAEVYPLVVRPCKSGFVSLGIVSDEEFDRFAIASGLLALAGDERFSSREKRMEHRDELDRELEDYLLHHEADDIVATLQANGVASAKVADTREILSNPQLKFRRFWTSAGTRSGTMPGNPIPDAKVFACRSLEPTPPTKGAHGTLPLEGITVVDFTAFWAGPSTTRCLADLGAEVIWIERPRARLDFDAHLSDPRALVQHVYHQKMNRHKCSVVLDLDTDAGRDAAKQLASRADVIVENFRPGVAGRMGLGPDELCTKNPKLVYVSLSGFGSSGPWGDWRSYGPNIEAASSILARTGYADGEPMRLGHALPDGVAGLAGALAALRGLRERDQRGRGGWYDISQLEVYTALSGEDILATSVTGATLPRMGNGSRTGAVQGVYRCLGEDQWIAIRLDGETDIERFAAATGLVTIIDRVRARARDDSLIDAMIGSYTATQDKFALADILQSAGLEALPVFAPDELVKNPHVLARGIFVNAKCGNRKCLMPGSPLHSDPPLTNPHGVAPRFGEHTARILEAI